MVDETFAINFLISVKVTGGESVTGLFGKVWIYLSTMVTL